MEAECDLCRSVPSISNTRAWPVIRFEWQWLILKVLTKCYNLTWVFAEAINVLRHLRGQVTVTKHELNGIHHMLTPSLPKQNLYATLKKAKIK